MLLEKVMCNPYEMFRNVVLDREVLNIAIHAQCDIRAEVAEFEMNSYRKAAYRQYILWKYGKHTRIQDFEMGGELL